jgi:hypothetical protein
MESLLPLPWAHVLFGERAMLCAAELVYDSPEFVPRHWDLDENGRKKPNKKWRHRSTFREQGYVNELDIPAFQRLARSAGFEVDRLERRSFSGSALRRGVGRLAMSLPTVGEFFASYVAVELQRID